MTKSNLNPKLMERLRAARSVKEILSIVEPVEDLLSELGAKTDRLLKSVSSVKMVKHKISLSNRALELSDIAEQDEADPDRLSGKIRRGVDARIPKLKTQVTGFKIPDMSKLTRDNETLADLTDVIKALDLAEQVLLGGSLSDVSSRNATLDHIRNSQKEAREILNNHLTAMSKIAKKTMPSQHKAVIKAVSAYIESVIDSAHHSGLFPRTFIYQPARNTFKYTAGNSTVETVVKDTVQYQTFIFVENFMNTDGEIFDSYAFVLTGVLDLEDGKLAHYLTTIKDDAVPGSFNLGREVENSGDLKRRINSLLSIDHFTTREDRKILPYSTQTLRRNTGLLGSSDKVDRVRIFGDEIYVRLVQGLNASQEQNALEDISNALRSIFSKDLQRGNNALKLVVQNSRSTGRKIYKFFISPVGKQDKISLTVSKLKDIADILELHPSQVDSIRQALK